MDGLAHEIKQAATTIVIRNFICFLPNAKLSDCRRKRKVEREQRVQIAAVRRAERQFVCSVWFEVLLIRGVDRNNHVIARVNHIQWCVPKQQILRHALSWLKLVAAAPARRRRLDVPLRIERKK